MDELDELAIGRTKNTPTTKTGAVSNWLSSGKMNPKHVREKQKNYIIEQWEDDEDDDADLAGHLKGLKDLPLDYDQASNKSNQRQPLPEGK